MDVNGKVAVVTGAASGIGFALSKALMAAGAKGVAMADLQADALQAHAATIDGLAVPTDVTDEAAISALFEQAEGELGFARRGFSGSMDSHHFPTSLVVVGR